MTNADTGAADEDDEEDDADRSPNAETAAAGCDAANPKAGWLDEAELLNMLPLRSPRPDDGTPPPDANENEPPNEEPVEKAECRPKADTDAGSLLDAAAAGLAGDGGCEAGVGRLMPGVPNTSAADEPQVNRHLSVQSKDSKQT